MLKIAGTLKHLSVRTEQRYNLYKYQLPHGLGGSGRVTVFQSSLSELVFSFHHSYSFTAYQFSALFLSLSHFSVSYWCLQQNFWMCKGGCQRYISITLKRSVSKRICKCQSNARCLNHKNILLMNFLSGCLPCDIIHYLCTHMLLLLVAILVFFIFLSCLLWL